MAPLGDSYKDVEATRVTRVTVEIKFCENDLGSRSTEFLSLSNFLLAGLISSNTSRRLTIKMLNYQQQLMENMSDMELELQKRAAISVETISKEPYDTNEHFDLLKKKPRLLHVALSIPS
ncbi:hypothetical protein OCU04_009560 [Sclerotinia nivalis]|uniref:Uncharacterized protein n=1 Tax=Sclerotinia nivalis TaxID=352851 RepID=A0A9X0AGH5_9HELO|nr:hypothetical protein OCU04_009560 [Sclerotinia nivalis]